MGLNIEQRRHKTKGLLSAIPGDFFVLNTDLDIHGATERGGKYLAGGVVNVFDAEVVEALDLALHLFPPLVGGAGAVGVDNNFFGAAAGFLEAFFAGQAEFNPQFYFVAQAFLPKIGLVFGANAFTEAEHIARVQGESQKPQHKALVCFGGVLRDGEAVLLVVVAINVDDIEVCFADARAKCHDRVPYLRWILSATV